MNLLITISVITTLCASFIPVILTILRRDKGNRKIFSSLLAVFISFNSIWYSVLLIELIQSNVDSSLLLDIISSFLLFITRFIFLVAFMGMFMQLLDFKVPKRFVSILRISGIIIVGIWVLGWLEFFLINSLVIGNNFLLYTDILIFFIVIISCIYLIYQTKELHETNKQIAIKMLCLTFLIPMLFGVLKWLAGGILKFESSVWERLSIHFLVFLMNVFISIWLVFYSSKLKGFKILKTGKAKIKIDDLISKYNISKREIEVIELICEGYSNKEIADELFISIETVKDHNSRIYLKTQVKNRTQLAKLFLE